MKTVKIIFAVGLLSLFNSGFAQPQERYRRQDNSQQEFRQRGSAGLDLSDEQLAKAKEIRLRMQKAALPIRNKIGENQAKMRTLTTAEAPDMKAINKLIDEKAKLTADLAKLRAANHQEFRKMLTEEQRVEFDSRRHGRQPHRGLQNGAGQGRGRGSAQGQKGHFKGQLE